ncbi:133_t:CDS:2 [Funneliformis geosporum]|uniref:133_t:CDS:1 n=1 Tax=Funneliformis geosporum TaxID=1117311 RepID=A0A9W4SFF0_9GLOM|nr:133_t:CDS:2 [Funneliformis geosporum]
MSLNPINEIGESPRSTINSLSTSTTSSASSFSQHLRAPISTSLPSYSSSASTYVGPVPERTEIEIGTTFHEKSLSTGSISVKDNNSVTSMPYIPQTSSISNHKINNVYDTPVTSKDLEKMEQGGQQHDTWGSLVVKVLPLFNGEGLKLCIEDLNELVRRCISDRSTQLLYEEINELLESGMFTLNGKLIGVPDEKLVSRLVELWSFYFGTVIPYFEGVFLPLQIHNSTAQLNHTSIRRLVLMSFRDHVILPMGNRVEEAFNKLFHDFDSGIPVTDTATRMLQMSYILSSVLSDDDKQRDMDRILGKLKNNWKLFMRRRDRRVTITSDNLVTTPTTISNPAGDFPSITL